MIFEDSSSQNVKFCFGSNLARERVRFEHVTIKDKKARQIGGLFLWGIESCAFTRSLKLQDVQ